MRQFLRWRPTLPAGGGSVPRPRSFVGEEEVTGTLRSILWWATPMRGRINSYPAFFCLCRSFGGKSGGNKPLSRDWLARLWAEKKKKKSGDLSVAFGKRKNPVAVQVDAIAESEATGRWTSLFSSLRSSFLSGAAPANHAAQEGLSRRPQMPPPVLQPKFGSASQDLPEVRLESLLARANLVITRDIEWANIMFAFEQESRYIIFDASNLGSPVGYIREQSNIIYRQLLRSRRPFTAHITDAWGKEIFTVRRPFWWINSTIYAEVDNEEIGVVHRRWHLWRRIYDLYLMNKQFAMVENPGFWNWTFTLKDDHENLLAEINRDWRGIGLELFTDAGQYVIRFGCADPHGSREAHADIQELNVSRPLTLSERAVAVALAISLDCDYFSRSGGWGLPFVVAGE